MQFFENYELPAPTMDRVTVVDSDFAHALILKSHLEGVGCFVEICSNARFASAMVTKQGAQVVVLVHQSPVWWKGDVRKLCDAMARLDESPVVLCLLRWSPQGPGDRLYGDELKVTVFHED